MTDRLELKSALTVSDTGAIEGIAWPFGTPDRVGDIIEKGAFTGDHALPALPMLFGHDQTQVIGFWNSVRETSEGLTVKGQLLVDDVERAREVRAMVRAGAVSGLSIGFVPSRAVREGRGRRISALQLHEISIVAVPSHPGSRITSMKTFVNEEPRMENEELAPEATPAAVETKEAQAPAIDTKAFDRVIARLDAIEARAARPAVTGVQSPIMGEAEVKDFTAYIGGDDKKSLTLSSDTANHVLAPEQVSAEFIRNLVEFSPIRAIADVRSTESTTVILPKRTSVTNATWVGEVDTRTGSQASFAPPPCASSRWQPKP